MTPTAALHSTGQGHGLPVHGGHDLHGFPGLGMLPPAELLPLLFMTGLAGLGSDRFSLVYIRPAGMFFSMAYRAGHIVYILAMLALLPVLNNPGGHLLMTLNTVLLKSGFGLQGVIGLLPGPKPAF